MTLDLKRSKIKVFWKHPHGSLLHNVAVLGGKVVRVALLVNVNMEEMRVF